jgi:hypothetical protein
MFYAWDIVVPAGTTEDNPKTQTLKLSKGVITRAEVKFPAGCHGLVKVRLYFHEFQLVPLSRGEWVTGDDETCETEAYYEMMGTPYELKFIGASPDCTYDHGITVRVQVLPKAIASWVQVIEALNKLLRRLGVNV